MSTYHIHNADFLNKVGSPSTFKTNQTFKLTSETLGFEGPGCRGQKNVKIKVGTYKIVSRKHFKGGTQEIILVS